MSMYVSIQTVCGCHGYLYFESIHCDRCRSLIPYQISDESLNAPPSKHRIMNGNFANPTMIDKQTAMLTVQYQKHTENTATTGRVRFRTSCPFCNSSVYILRYYCKRERIYHHLRINNFGDNEQSIYKTIAESQNFKEKHHSSGKLNRSTSSTGESIDDSYSLSGSLSQQPPSTILYDQSALPSSRDAQIENERTLYALNNLEGDLFHVLRSGLFYDTLILCQDNVKLQAHRCILGGRSQWFRNLLSEYHDTNMHDDYILQISIDDISSEVMNEILNFMYTNRCLISLKNAPELLIAAKRFELERLRKQIAEFLHSRLTVENAIEMLICAHEAGSQSLKSACIRLINRHAERIKRTEKWKIFKTEYVDLIPELYENRVEKPAPPPQAILPDIFPSSTVPAENLQVLNELYDNPVRHRLPSPVARVLPVPPKNQTPGATTSLQPLHQEPVKEMKMPPTVTRTTNPPHSLANQGQESNSNKKKVTTTVNNNKRRTGPPPPAVPLVRNVFPSVRESSDIDQYRRPVNTNDKNTGQPVQNNPPGTRTTNNPPPQKAAPTTQTIYHQPEKLIRTISPDNLIEIQRSPTLTSLPREEHGTLARVVSVDTVE